MRGDKYSKLLVRILHPQESTMVHDRIQKEPKVMVSSQSTQEKSLVAIETDASGALICWWQGAHDMQQAKCLHVGADKEFQKTLDRSKRTHLAALPLRTMRSNASCSCRRPCKPETKARNRQSQFANQNEPREPLVQSQSHLSVHTWFAWWAVKFHGNNIIITVRSTRI
jgi:hypothetical protein